MLLVALALSAIIILGQSQTYQSTVPATTATTTTGSPTVTTTATTTALGMPLCEADSISQITNDLGGRWDMWAGQEWHFNLDLKQKDNIITGTMNCLSRYELETYVSGQVSSNGTVEFIRRGPPGYNWTQYYVGKLTATPDHILMNGNYNKGGHLEPANSQWYATVEKSTTITPTTNGTSSPPTGTTFVENSKLKWDRNGHYYEIVKKDLCWQDAESYARNQQFTDPETGSIYNGHLATIASSDENSWIVDTIILPLETTNVYPWIGGFQKESSMNKPMEGWQWITGEEWSWTNWKDGEPNDLSGEYDEMYLKIYPDGKWNDESIDGEPGWDNYILIEYEPTMGQTIQSRVKDPDAPINDRIIIPNSNRRLFRVFIDRELVGRVDANGVLVLPNLAPGPHDLEVVYVPHQDYIASDRTTALTMTIGDNIAVLGWSPIPNEVHYYDGRMTIDATDASDEFSLGFHPATYAVPLTEYGTEEIYNVITAFIGLAQGVGTPIPGEIGSIDTDSGSLRYVSGGETEAA